MSRPITTSAAAGSFAGRRATTRAGLSRSSIQELQRPAVLRVCRRETVAARAVQTTQSAGLTEEVRGNTVFSPSAT